MGLFLKQSTAITVSFGPAVLNTDGVTLVTNLTGTGANQTENTTTGIRLSKNGGAFAARHAAAGASTYDAFGNYLVPLDTTDTNTLGTLRMQFANAAAFCPIFQDFMVLPANMWNSLFGTGGSIPDAVAGANGGLPLGDASGRVDIGKWIGNAPDALSSGKIPADIKLWLTAAPDSLSSGKIPADLKLWLATAPLALSSQQVQAIVNAYASGQAPLQPTTAGRTLDVSAGGEAGLDWANVGSPGTTVGLSGTTIKAVTDAVSVGSITGDVAGKVLGGGASVITGDGVKATLDLTQAIPTSNTAETLGDALNAARSQGFGKWTIVGTTLTIFAADGTTVVRTFSLAPALGPFTSRT